MRDNKGFSLVELIVVIAIMAILAAVAVVSYSVYIDRAQQAADQQYLSDVVYRAELYAMEHQIQLEQVVVAPVVDGPEDIALIVKDSVTGELTTIVTDEIFESVGGYAFGEKYNNGMFDPNVPGIEIPDEVQGQAHTHDFVVQTEPSTCKKHGTKTTTCADSACTYSKVEKLPLGEHDYPAEPNVVQDDFACYVCADCGKIIIKSTSGQPIVPIG